MKRFGLVVALGFASGVFAADHECLVKREVRRDNSNTGYTKSVTKETATLAVPAKAGEQAHATLTLKTESGADESYLVYVWQQGSSLTAQATFGENGQLGLQLPADGKHAASFQLSSSDEDAGWSQTVIVTLECRAK